MKKILAIVLTLALSLSLTSAFAGEPLTIIATENPHAECWNWSRTTWPRWAMTSRSPL